MQWLPGRRHGIRQRRGILLLAVALIFAAANAAADQTERRLRIGLKVFAAVVAADQGLADKRTDRGRLRLLLVYLDDRPRAEELAHRLDRIGAIREWPLEVHPVALDELADAPAGPVAGMFLAQWLNHRLSEAVAYARRNNVLLFSPFKGDVEQGAMSGLSVRDRILPYVNSAALQAAGIQLKPFFLEVARRHE